MTSYLYQGSNADYSDLNGGLECQAGPENNPCEGKKFLISGGTNLGVLTVVCLKCGATYKFTPAVYDVEIIDTKKSR
jgi:hypothetical protein